MILAIGDSHMYPACTEQKFKQNHVDNLVPVFAQKADLPFRCWAKNGASNQWIEHHIEYFLSDDSWPKDTVLLVGWTSVERQEWPWLSSNISVCAGSDFNVPDPMRARLIKWRTSITADSLKEFSIFWHERIHVQHKRLCASGIKHMFYNTYASFACVNNHQDWHGCFFQPYDVHGDMYHYLIDKGVNPLTHDPFHFGEQGHTLWAQTLYQHAVSSGIL